VDRKTPYPRINNFNITSHKMPLILVEVEKVKKKSKKMVLTFNSNGYNRFYSYTAIVWKPFTKYVLSFKDEKKENRM
jgi:hypothetical protein